MVSSIRKIVHITHKVVLDFPVTNTPEREYDLQQLKVPQTVEVEDATAKKIRDDTNKRMISEERNRISPN